MKCFKKVIFVFVLILFAKSTLHANQYLVQWADTLDNGGYSQSTGIAVDNNGNVYCTGDSYINSTYDYFTAKYDSTGNIVWADTINNAEGDGIVTDKNGNIYVTGTLSNNWGALTIKYNNLMNVVWADTLAVNGSAFISQGIDVDDSGYVYITGYFELDTNYVYLTVKYDSMGNVVWEDTLNNNKNNQSTGIAVDKNGNVYVTGYSHIDTTDDWLTVKYNSTGNIIWVDTLDNGGNDSAQDIAVDKNGNVYVTGYSHIDTTDDWLTVKYNSTGNIIWVDTLDNGGNDLAQDIAVDRNGNVYVTGYSLIEGTGDELTVKYDSMGNILWADTFELAEGTGITVDSSGNIYTEGDYFGGSYSQFLTIKYSYNKEDIGVKAVTSPDSGTIPQGYHNVSAIVENFGNVSESFDVYAEVIDTTNGWSTIFRDTVSISNLAAGDTSAVVFDSCNYQPNAVYLTRIYVNLPDTNVDNDTAKIYSTVASPQHNEDIGIISITSPDSGFISPTYHNVSAIVENLGNVTESFDVYAEVIDTTNGWTTIFKDTVSISNLAAGDTSTVVFDSCNYQPNAVYLTRAYVNLPDTNTANDTAEIYSSTMHYSIMFVEDAEGYGAPYHPDSTWYVPLTNLVGSDSVYWYLTTDETQDGPNLTAMESADLVIWNTYDYYNAPCFTDNDTTNINDYINEGGKIWLIGQDIVYSMLGSKTAKRNRLERVIFPWLDQFGVDSISEDFLSNTTMTIQGTGQVTGNPISVISDFNTSYDGYLYPDIIYPDTSAQAVLIDPDSSVTIGIITNDSTEAFWAADGRGADLTPGGDWEILINKMLSLFGITHLGINEKAVINVKYVKTSLIVKRPVNTMIDFSYQGNREADILVSDINGRIVKKFVNVNPGSRLGIGSNRLTAGIYFITVKGTNVRSKITVIK